MDIAEVDHAVRCRRARPQAVEVLERATVDLRACSHEGLGSGVRAGESHDLVAGAAQLFNDS